MSTYDVVVPDGQSAVPQVSATARTGNVAITQATSVPGVATVTSTGLDGIVLSGDQLDRLNNLAPAAGERHDEANMARIDR